MQPCGGNTHAVQGVRVPGVLRELGVHKDARARGERGDAEPEHDELVAREAALLGARMRARLQRPDACECD